MFGRKKTVDLSLKTHNTKIVLQKNVRHFYNEVAENEYASDFITLMLAL